MLQIIAKRVIDRQRNQQEPIEQTLEKTQAEAFAVHCGEDLVTLEAGGDYMTLTRERGNRWKQQ